MLSTAQIKALRWINDGTSKADEIDARTRQALVRKGYLSPAGNLTWAADVFLRKYIERTGDGPEDLKAMFRF